MTTDEKLAAILAAVQTDPGNRGLARDPHDNLFTATQGDFERACWSISQSPDHGVLLHTGFNIPPHNPPRYETDGPLGAVFFMRAFAKLIPSLTCTTNGYDVHYSMVAGLNIAVDFERNELSFQENTGGHFCDLNIRSSRQSKSPPISIVIETVGRTAANRCYSMRGTDITEFSAFFNEFHYRGVDPKFTIGIGDGGNEIGMGKIPHETIVKNIPNGDKIHCVVPTDHLIVAGVSNWGAYALAAGIFVLKGITPPPDLFDPDREREILEVMVREGPLVDGVTGRQEATVDGLSWEEYTRPLVQIAQILKS